MKFYLRQDRRCAERIGKNQKNTHAWVWAMTYLDAVSITPRGLIYILFRQPGRRSEKVKTKMKIVC
jgi:hypothetical protein